MHKISNPIIWLRRFRHRCGYGVHSPFAFRLLTDVVYEKLPYYGYLSLDRHLPLAKRQRHRKGLHLLLRMANHLQPADIFLPENAWWEKRYIKAGCKTARLHCSLKEINEVDLCFLCSPNDEAIKHLHQQSVLILDNLHLYRKWFDSIPSVVSFDLYDLGIAFFDPNYNKQRYIVNF